MLLKKFLVGLLLFSFVMHHTSVVCISVPAEKIVEEEKPQVIIVVQPIIEKEPVEYKDYSYIPDLTQKELFDTIIELTKYKMYLATSSHVVTTRLALSLSACLRLSRRISIQHGGRGA